MTSTLARTAVRMVSVFSFIAATAACALAQGMTEPIRLIPWPKQLSPTPAQYRLAKTRIVLADPKSEEDRVAAQDFMEDLKQTAGLSLQIGSKRGYHSILIGKIESPSVQAALKHMTMPTNLGSEGYVLMVNSNQVVVAGASSAGIFYGL